MHTSKGRPSCQYLKPWASHLVRHACAWHIHTHSCCFLWFTGTLHRHNGFYTVQIVCAIAIHLPYTKTPSQETVHLRSGEFVASQAHHTTPLSFNQLLVLLAVWAGAESYWKMKSAYLKSWSTGKTPKLLGKWVQWRWFSKNTMDQHQQMTFHPKSSQTVET